MNSFRLTSLISLALTCFSFACSASEPQKPPSEGNAHQYAGELDPNLAAFTAQLNASIPTLLDQYDIPGASVALVANGQLVWTGGFGWANAKQGRTVTGETVFDINSLSKPVTAWGVMTLVDEGRLQLDVP